MLDVKPPHSDLSFNSVDQGTIKIESSGAYIANDHLLREYNRSSRTPTPPSSGQPSSDSEADTDSSGEGAPMTPNHESLTVSLDGKNLAVDTPTKRQRAATPDAHEVAKNITLPKHNSEVIHISVDIGGTLTKLVYFTKSKDTEQGRNGGKFLNDTATTESFSTEVLKLQLVEAPTSFTSS